MYYFEINIYDEIISINFCLHFHLCFLFAKNMISKGKQKDPSSNKLQPLLSKIQTIHEQGVKSTTRKRRQCKNSTPMRRFHRNKGIQPDVVLETVENFVHLPCIQTFNHKFILKNIQ